MSANLYVRVKEDGKPLSKELMRIFRDELTCDVHWRDGIVTREYLQALTHARVEGAKELLELWDRHEGNLEFSIGY